MQSPKLVNVGVFLTLGANSKGHPKARTPCVPEENGSAMTSFEFMSVGRL